MILPVRGATSSASEHSYVPSISVLRTLKVERKTINFIKFLKIKHLSQNQSDTVVEVNSIESKLLR